MNKPAYPLEERTLIFAQKVISLIRSVPQNNLTNPILNQLIRSSTSIGANYREANGASSKKDFKNKIFICKKESKETKYWLELLKNVFSDESDRNSQLIQEAHELTLIFSKIASNTK